MQYDLTLYQSLKAVDSPPGVRATWPEIVRLFSTHLRTPTKDSTPGFGPYALVPPPGPCYHTRGVVSQIHRCDACVTHLSMAIFDVDIGTPSQVQTCEDWLAGSGVARLWYSSFSFDPGQRHPSLRLVIPLSRPVAGEVWSSFRASLIRRYSIPVDPTKCGGRSHFYYVPSCPPDAYPLTVVGDGVPLEVDTVPVHREHSLSQRSVVERLASWAPDEGQGGLVDLGPLHTRLMASADRQGRRQDPDSRTRAETLRRLVRGQALAQKGSRDVTTSRAAMSVVGVLPEANLHELEVLFRDSLVAMVNEGSSLDQASVRRKLVSAMRKQAEQEVRRAEIEKTMLDLAGSIPVVST